MNIRYFATLLTLFITACGDGLPHECSNVVSERMALQKMLEQNEARLPMSLGDFSGSDVPSSRAEMIRFYRTDYVKNGEIARDNCQRERQQLEQYRALLEQYLSDQEKSE